MQKSSTRHSNLSRRTITPLFAISAGIFLFAAGYTVASRGVLSLDRQQEVAQRGAQVMPFDLTKTAHTFVDAETGGREVVTANDSGDTTQINLIRTHLQEEVQKFRGGDFSDPSQIHGENMPGLQVLRGGASRIAFTYEELPNGAAIIYQTSDAPLVAALHQWFAAQRGDHGSHHT